MSRARARHALRTRRSTTLRRVRALLAGGLVLGIGASVTLAAWTDNEYAKATLTASVFGIQGSINNTAWADYTSTATVQTMAFTVPATALALSPSTTVYTSYWIKTTSTTNVAGTVQLANRTFTGTGLEAHLTYQVASIAATATCNATTIAAGTQVVASGTALNAALSTTGQAIASGGTATLQYCFAITMPAGAASAAQGLNTVPTWQFTATSS